MITSPSRGYTLIELIVSLGIFSVVMLAATAAYLSLVSLDRQARATADVVTNLTFAMDSMTREVRTGTTYRCTPGDADGNSTDGSCHRFSFTDSRSPSRSISYFVSNHQLMESINGVNYVLTDPRVSVDRLDFYVRGVGTTGANAGVEPQVLMVISGTLQTKDKTVSFSLQSSATERYIDL
jgi:prepilin-type N-terminal cleavage/methylation domain-containing protein